MQTATSTLAAPSTPTATATPSPTQTATSTLAAPSTPTATATPSPTPTATASSTPTVASFSLRGFTNGLWLEQQDPQLASSIKQLTWTQDGIDGAESKAIQSLLYIAVLSRPVASSIVSLTWVQDGVEDVEAEAIGWMNNIRSVQVASSVVSLGWVQDGVDAVEVRTIEGLSYMANKDAEVASSVVSLGWVQDGIEDVEAKTIEGLSYIAYEHAEVASSVVSLDWLQDGIDDVEAEAIRWMNNIGSTEVASSVVLLGWVQDGVDAVEVKAIENLSYIVNKDAEVASSIVSLGWVQDGIEDAEVGLIGNFVWISKRDPGAALQIAGMPFVETIEPPDISAIEALSRLATFAPETFVRVMSHTALLDGISDDLAPVVATLHGIAGTNPGLIDVLLDPTKISLERRAITLPLSGDVILVIIRTAPGAARSMDLLEHSVRGAEDYMGVPLPTSYVGLLFENSVSAGAAGQNFGTHIVVLPEYDVDDGTSSTIAHEVAHYYWSGNEDWVDEGAANVMASIVDGARTGRPVGVVGIPCGYAGNIGELESLGAAHGDIEFGCNYSLGERLFVDLHRTLGEDRFRQGFRALYLASEVEDDADDGPGMSVGVEHIREAFRSDDGAESAVIARWYDESEPHDLSRLDATPVDPGLSSINGRIDEAYVSMKTDGPAVSTFSAQDVNDWVYFILKYSYNVSGGSHEVPLEIVQYYEDGFEFRRRSRELTAEARYAGGTSWFAVGSPPSEKWAPGRYWVYVYAGDRKVAEVQYEVTP